jgi:cobalt-zinc-cadmium efflux system protein
MVLTSWDEPVSTQSNDMADHDEHKGHSHAPKDFGVAFAIGSGLNLIFVVIEAGYGFLANSTALLADAGHNLGDVLGLLMAWGASALVRQAPSRRYTYGLRSTTILAALANAIFLLVAVGAIAWEALGRFSHPEPIASKTVMVVAGIGILINAMTAWMFMAGQDRDLNIRGAYLHMAADAAVSFGVLVAAGAILVTGWLWLDPMVSLCIAGLIMWGTWGLLRDSTNLALHAVPAGIDPEQVRDHLGKLTGVCGIHDLHIWAMSTNETALTCHLVMPEGCPGDTFLADVAEQLQHRFGIAHSTLQVERGQNACALAPETVV